MAIILWLSFVLFSGCAGDDPATPTSVLDLVLDLADAEGVGYPVDSVVVELVAKSVSHRVELEIGSMSATGTLNDVPPGIWTLHVSVSSSRLLLATGTREFEFTVGTTTIPLDFINWGRLFPDIPRKILFIGHSHTLANGGIDVHFAGLANEFDERWNVTASKVAFGGWGLNVHWNDPVSAAREAITSQYWDAVVLHGSIALLEDHANYTDYAGRFCDLIRSEYSDPWLIMNWAPPGMVELTSEIVTRVEYTARATGAKMAPLGRAWRTIVNDEPGIELFADIAGHPTPEGTQLAVSTLFASMFGISPVGGRYKVDESVSDGELATIQQVAWETASGDVAVEVSQNDHWRETLGWTILSRRLGASPASATTGPLISTSSGHADDSTLLPFAVVWVRTSALPFRLSLCAWRRLKYSCPIPLPRPRPGSTGSVFTTPSCAASNTQDSRIRVRSRPRPFLQPSRAAMSWASPRPERARRRPSAWRCSTDCSKENGVGPVS